MVKPIHAVEFYQPENMIPNKILLRKLLDYYEKETFKMLIDKISIINKKVLKKFLYFMSNYKSLPLRKCKKVCYFERLFQNLQDRTDTVDFFYPKLFEMFASRELCFTALYHKLLFGVVSCTSPDKRPVGNVNKRTFNGRILMYTFDDKDFCRCTGTAIVIRCVFIPS